MIVTSLKCYLNILTQLMSKDNLLNANYYVMGNDRNELNDTSMLENITVVTDETIKKFKKIKEEGINSIKIGGIPSVGFYNISKSPASKPLSPTVAAMDVIASSAAETFLNGTANSDVLEYFIKQLKQQSTMLDVYKWLFRKKPKGNGLQILVIYDSHIVETAGNIICEYLSSEFGADIKFIDPMYIPKVYGKEEYKGNKERAKENITKLRDYDFKKDYQTMNLSSASDNSTYALETWLCGFDVPELFHLYEILYPNDPLPTDNYTKERIIEILLYKAEEMIQYYQIRKSPSVMEYDDSEYLD